MHDDALRAGIREDKNIQPYLELPPHTYARQTVFFWLLLLVASCMVVCVLSGVIYDPCEASTSCHHFMGCGWTNGLA